MTSRTVKRLFACAAIVPALVATIAAADLSGTWALQFQKNDSPELYQGDCSFNQEGDRLSGSCLSGFESLVPVRGRVTGTGVTFEYTTGIDAGSTLTFSGQLDEPETAMKGTWRFVDQKGNKGEGTFTAAKR